MNFFVSVVFNQSSFALCLFSIKLSKIWNYIRPSHKVLDLALFKALIADEKGNTAEMVGNLVFLSKILKNKKSV